MDTARRRILIVEDEEDLAASLKYNLEKEGGYVVATAGTGEQGLSLARGRKFDLVMLDMMLPGIDGLEVCRTLRASGQNAAIPIIFLTARIEESDKLIGLEIGADDYLTKPFSMKEVLARVKPTTRQVDLSEAPREANVAGAFAVRAPVQGESFVLLDDVLTTGATAREATRVLLDAGATRVDVLAFARAVRLDAR